jgi:hypothetical protein
MGRIKVLIRILSMGLILCVVSLKSEASTVTLEAIGDLPNDLHKTTSTWSEDKTTWQLQPTFDSTVVSTAGVGESHSRPGWLSCNSSGRNI